jgi:serine/threonine protein kinase
MVENGGRVGQQLGNYSLLRLLGRGGFADVYLGQHIHLKRHAAIKIMRAQLAEQDSEQFMREAHILASLSHPNIVRILDFAIQDNTPFLVMEYAPGGTLRTLHPKSTPVPLDTLLPSVMQVAAALQYAHEQRIVHRDVKPENMLLGPRSEVLLSDFGLALLTPHTLSARTEAMEQPLAGTSPYLAPEQLHGKPRPASDQYALGVVVYEWLCGAPPFHGSPFEIAMQHLSLPPPPLRERMPDLSPAIEEVVLRALAKEPAQRYASVQDFAAALQQACAGPAIASDSSITATPGPAGDQRPSIPPLHISLLGDFRLISGETPITSIDSPRLQSLLAYLALRRTAPQPRSRLAFLMWPDSTDEQALTNLRNAVHKLRHAWPNADAFLRIARQDLQWQAARPDVPWTLDVQDFERTLSRAHEAEQAKDLKAAREALTQAVELYQGDLLPGCYDEWIIPERDRLRQACLQALDRLIDLLEDERDYATAISMALRLLRLDSLHEATYRQLMRLYAASGDRASALRIYHACTTILERELGAEPGRATREVYERLLQKEEEGETKEPEESRVTLVAATPLVGRQKEWERLQAAWNNVASGRPHMVVLIGEAGVGKTRLAEELLNWVGRQGIVTSSAHCYAAEGALAYAPVAAWLRFDALRPNVSALAPTWRSEVARLLPDLLESDPHLPRPGPLTESWQRQRLFEALARAVLSGHAPRVLHLDDLQWCDRETLEWLHYLLHFDPNAPLLLVGTIRAEEMPDSSPLASLLSSLRRDGLITEIEPGPLNAADTAFLASQIAGSDLTSPDVAVLYKETEGNPLYIVETMRAGTLNSDRAAPVSTCQVSPAQKSLLPQTVQAVIAARLAQLSPPARELINLAAVIGRAFTFAVLAQASGADEDTLVSGLDELWQRRIVREQGQDAYDFSHDKIREVAYTALSAARRRLLHRKVAEALVIVHKSNPGAVSGQIAVHYERANFLQEAISYSRQAGEAAQQIFANEEALAAYQKALHLLERTPLLAEKQEIAAQCYERIGDSVAISGEAERAEDAYQKALDQLPVEDHIKRAALQRKTAKTWAFKNQFEEALRIYALAEAALGNEPTASAPKWWQEWIEIQDGKMDAISILYRFDEMDELLDRIRPIVQQYGTPAQRAELFISSALYSAKRNGFTVSAEMADEARAGLMAYQELGDPIKVGWGHYTLSSLYQMQQRLVEAEEQVCEALALGERTGDVLLQIRSLSLLSLIYRQRGQVEEVRRTASQALKLFAAVQSAHSSAALSKANLAWIAWCEGNLPEAKKYAGAALKGWESTSPPSSFQWPALFLLIAITQTQNEIAEAIDNARKLLVPIQQRLPDALSGMLEAAIGAWDAQQADSARAHLQQATALAQGMGYL